MTRTGPEWVPLDMGKHIGSVHKTHYAELAAGLPDLDLQNGGRILDRMAQTVVPDEALLQHFNVDFRWLVPNWVQVTERDDLEDGGYFDMWGVPYKGAHGDHYAVDTLAKAPLADCEAAEDVLNADCWPDPEDPAQFAGLRERAKHLHDTTSYVLGADAIKAGPLMSALQMRGYEQFFMDLVINPDLADAVLGKITDILCQMWTRYMNEVGEFVDLAYVTDDLGSQTSLLISPKVYRKRIKPFHTRLHQHIKKAGNCYLMVHTDGAVLPLIEDLIETGADILNPVQTSTSGMEDTSVIKEKFGDRLAFHGAMDVQQMMPGATHDELRWEVARRLKDLGSDGGYIIAPCHNIGHDIPVENTLKFFELVREMGRYPLNVDDALTPEASYFERLKREGEE
ncbi:uroporphyrinogen decarboxylase family protein [Ruegeria lacuscaerulensis]|uniref:uroporphyrinogen decarboxylase family protein n=1 Tax=Ruegeria lacuscaerulensis TaxID=55218 RepID=UPI001480DEB3|nr:uroporphyrinogen decarboxylase family protein [Ruegeria lacuscaerulensis]